VSPIQSDKIADDVGEKRPNFREEHCLENGDTVNAAELVTAERLRSALWITLNRPHAKNALKFPETFVALERLLQQVREDVSLKAVVISGAGETDFCIGSDITFLEEAFRTRDFTLFRDYLYRINACFLALEDLPVPTIAMVQGRARAGGFELLLACDFVILASEAVIGDVHTPFGHMPGAGATQRLARKVGIQKAMEIILTGKWMSVEEAVQCGLALRSAPYSELRTATEDLVAQFENKTRDSLQFSKRALLRGWDLPLRDGIQLEIQSYVEYLATSEEPAEIFRKNQASRRERRGS